jgi:surface polysaccharide O-acyltransferase-like enzyme
MEAHRLVKGRCPSRRLDASPKGEHKHLNPKAKVVMPSGKLSRLVYSLPMARGIGILGVIVVHTTTASLAVRGPESFGNVLIFLNSSARFAVPLFIILSGFSLSLNPKNENPIPFYRRTLKYLVLPYIIYSLIYSLTDVYHYRSITRVIGNLVLASASPHLWFGLLILQLYLLHPVLSHWYRTRKHHGLVLCSGLFLQMAWTMGSSFLTGNLDSLRSGAPALERLGALCFVSYLGYFLAGYFLCEHAEDVAGFLQKVTFTGGLFIGWLSAAIGLYVYWGRPLFRNASAIPPVATYIIPGVLFPLLSFLSAGIVLWFVQYRVPSQNAAHRMLHAFGLYSYGIYYVHGLVLWIMIWAIRQTIMPYMINGLFFVIVFPSTALVSLQLIKRLSRWPFSKYLT